MNKTYLAACITAAIGIGYIIYYMTVLAAHDPYRVIGCAIVMVVEIFLMLFAYLILNSIPQTKAWSGGVFIGMLLTLLIGFGLCSSL